MMTTRAFSAVAVLLLSAPPATAPFMQSEPSAVAVLIRIEDQVQLASGSRKDTLTKSDVGRVLHAEDVLTCLTSGSKFTLLNSAFKEVQSTTQCRDGYRLPTAAGDYSQILTRYGRTGGRSRGTMPGFLLWPVTGVRTIPATASHLQWRKQSSGTISATAKEAGTDRVIWTRTGIDATLGELHDAALEAALRAQVEAGKPAANVDVRLSDAMNGSATISLLDQAAERKLERDLAASTTGLVEDARRLVRADVFLQANLPREALEEYLAMLERAPQSSLLLAKAAALAVEISDPRAAELVKRSRAAEGS